MALIRCDECGQTVSDAAPTCPRCGYPIRNVFLGRRSGYGLGYVPSGQRPGSALALAYSVVTPLGLILLVLGIVLSATATHYVPGYSSYYGSGGYGYPYYGHYETDYVQQGYGIMSILLGVAFALASCVLFCVWLYQAWTVAPRDYYSPTPGQAVGFLFIPFFNLYWMFRAIPGLSLALQRGLEERDPSRPQGAGFGVGLAACITALIPYVNVVSFILFIIWINLANSAKNRLLAWESSQAPPEEPQRFEERPAPYGRPAPYERGGDAFERPAE